MVADYLTVSSFVVLVSIRVLPIISQFVGGINYISLGNLN